MEQKIATSTRISSKFMEEKLKIGWSSTDFAIRFNVTEEEFFELMRKNFKAKRTYDFYMYRLKENDKRRQKGIIRAKSSARRARKMAEMAGKYQKEDKETSEDANNVEEKEEDVNPLENLRKEYKETSDILCDLEKECEDFISKRKKLYEILVGKKEEIIEIQNLLKTKAQEVKSAISELKEISDKIESAKADLKSYREILKEYDAQIEALTKVSVKFLEDSSFEASSEVTLHENWKDIRNSWIDDEKFENLTMAELKQLAQAVAIKKVIEDTKRTSEIILSSDKLQSLFNEIAS